MYPSPEEETFLRAKIEVVHKSLLHLCAVAPITCSYIFEGVVHLVIATIEICEQVFEKPQLVELLTLHKITERQSCAESNSNETFAASGTRGENNDDCYHGHGSCNPPVVTKYEVLVHFVALCLTL